MKHEALENSNFILFAAKNYTNSCCLDDEEFFTDLNRIKYIKRLFRKYKESGDLKERLILNHLVILYNMFGSIPANRMLFFQLSEYYSYLKPFVEYLGYLLPIIPAIGNPVKNINTFEIVSNVDIQEKLKNI